MRLTIRIFVLAVLAATVLTSVGANAGIVPELSGSFSGSNLGPPMSPFTISYLFGDGVLTTPAFWLPNSNLTFYGGGVDWIYSTYTETTTCWDPTVPDCVGWLSYDFITTWDLGINFSGRWNNGLWARGTADTNDWGELFIGIDGGKSETEFGQWSLTVTTYTPEPTTGVLITGGLGLLGVWKRRLIG